MFTVAHSPSNPTQTRLERLAYLTGAEEFSRAYFGRSLEADELDRVIERFPR